MGYDIIKKIFPDYAKRIDKGLCPFCEHPLDISEFRDQLSIDEAKISGLCQKCQDKTFGY